MPLSTALCAVSEVIGSVVFYSLTSLYNIYSLTVILLNLCGELFMFIGWLEGINRKLKSNILVGASVICWMIWLTWNGIVFYKILTPSYLQIIFRGSTGSGSGPYHRKRRIVKWWRWDAGILRQPWWRCLQGTVGDLVIELLFRCWVCKPFFYSFWTKTLCLRLHGPQCLCCNMEQLYALVHAEAGILIYYLF